MKANAPSHAPSIRASPPITAITSKLIVSGRSTLPGAICPLHQTYRMPPSEARNAANPNASVRWRGTL